MQQTIYRHGHTLHIIQPDRNENKTCRILYLLIPETGIVNLEDTADSYGLTIVLISGMDWNKDLTPWPAPAVFTGQNDFAGNASEYRKVLIYELIPYTEEYMEIAACERILGGISLAGLFTIYTLYHTDLFAAGLSVSGSFWYDGFIDYMKEKKISETVHAIYFSVGIKERNTKNKRMRVVEKNTGQAAEILKESGVVVKMEQMPGNHFADVRRRVEKAVAWVVQECEAGSYAKQSDRNVKE